ncbi:MAG: prolyl oligopeptidase family serine peptidase [Spirochaetes bacterium]|nr:prolyl oligopeptidase family serine peptidase [Spirochaetota bacterium]
MMRPTVRHTIRAMAALLLLGALSCGDAGTAALPLSGGAGLPATVLGSGAVTDGGTDWTYYLLRLQEEGKEPSYAIWFPAGSGTTRPAVMVTMPYEGVTWDGDTPPASDIHDMQYYFQTAQFYLFHDFGVLEVFGRFYTGGSIGNEVEDMVMGLQFLENASGVDRGRIGIHGASWGGFEALYAAANAPAGAVPKAGVAFYPPSDFQSQMGYIENGIPTIADEAMRAYYSGFFVPHTERIRATVGDPADYSGWTADNLLSTLATPFLVLHDQWDSLVPFTQSQYLVDHSGGLVEPVWYYHPSPYDVTALASFTGHGDLRGGFSFPMSHTLAYTYLTSRIADPDQFVYTLYDDAALADFMNYLREYQCLHSRDMSWAAPRLLDLADPRVIMLEIDTGDFQFGASVVAAAVNAEWGTSYSAADIGAALAAGLPSCP